jgi:hypothetical protein
MERPFERPVPGMAVSARSDLPGILGLKHADIDVISNWRACRYRGCSGGAACIDAGARQQRDHAPKSYWLRVYDLYRCRVERQILRADWRRNTRPDALLCLQGPGAARFRDARGHVRFQPKIRHSPKGFSCPLVRGHCNWASASAASRQAPSSAFLILHSRHRQTFHDLD